MNLPDPRSAAGPAAIPAGRGVGGWLRLTGWTLFFVCGLAVLALRSLLPAVDGVRAGIATAIGDRIGLEVSVDRIEAHWSGLRPWFGLHGVTLRDADGVTVLQLEAVEASLAWRSLLVAEPVLDRIHIQAPDLLLERDPDGRLRVAGVTLDPGAGSESAGALRSWLTLPRELVVRGAALRWRDHLRGAPELALSGFDLRLVRTGGRLQFGLQASPPAALAHSLDVRGELLEAWPPTGEGPRGELYLAADGVVLDAWQPWLAYPVPLAGDGSVRAWLELEDGEVRAGLVRFALVDLLTRLGEDLPALALADAAGELRYASRGGVVSLGMRGLSMTPRDQLPIAPTDATLTLRGPGGRDGGEFALSRIDVAALAGVAAHLPLDRGLREQLALLAPRGALEDVRLRWSGAHATPTDWKLETRFDALALKPQGVLPGFEGISGAISGDDQRGRFQLSIREGGVDLPAVFPESRILLSLLQVDGGWSRRETGMELRIDSGRLENPDAEGRFTGTYLLQRDGPGVVDIAAHLTRADGGAVWRYLPLTVGAHTRDWLRDSLSGGKVPEARLRLRGDLRDFPYVDGQRGLFQVVTRFSEASLDYAKGWPRIDDIVGEIRFEGPGMFIKAERARILGAQLENVSAEVPDLDAADAQVMLVRGEAIGPTSAFLEFIARSPVSKRIGGLSDTLRAEGDGKLTLAMTMPLNHVEQTRLEGQFVFAENRIVLLDGLPPLESAGGTLEFTERTLGIPRALGRWLGEPFKLEAKTVRGQGVRFQAEGGARLVALQSLGLPLGEHLAGTVKWQAGLMLDERKLRLELESSLAGLSSSLPAPFNKRADEPWPVKLSLDLDGKGRESLRADVPGRIALALDWRNQDGKRSLSRGGIGVNAPLRAQDGGLHLNARLDALDVDAWQAVLEGLDDLAPGGGMGAERDVRAPGLPLRAASVRARRLSALGHDFDAVELELLADAGGWRGSLHSRQAVGTFDWRSADEGALRARFSQLLLAGKPEEEAVPSSSTGSTVTAAARGDDPPDPPAPPKPPRRLPALDVVADRFVLRDMDFGRLSLQAVNREGVWDMSSLELISPDARLSGSAHWLPGETMLTELDFRLDVGDIGAFLARLRYPDAVRGGAAALSGNVAWRGAPTSIDYPSLSGRLDLQAERGQFSRLEPGVGRLLGVLSLQSLPRRLTLDFRDVFSEGFAFDRISGSIEMREGVMRTENLQINGPAAAIAISGEADIGRETQALTVVVQPTLAESIAVGAAAGLINPVAGVVTYLAQKALSDPIERLFAYRYAITGSWADPRAEKLQEAPAEASGNDN